MGMKLFLFIAISLISACATTAPGGAKFSVGKCIERPWGAYTFKVAAIEKDTYFLYKVGYMGKEIDKIPFDLAHKEFQPINCP
tara:strand:+ start:1135 stop:1383 length:249 start_codon:yes stop_codon:yes gene_type:complete